MDLAATNLNAGYGDRPIVRDVDVRLHAGEICALVGPNGSGKSTLLRSLARLHDLDGGTVLLDGADLSGLSTREVARRLAMLAQAPVVPPAVTVAELVELGRYPHRRLLGGTSAEDREAVDWAIEAAGLQGFRHRTVDTLSGGERQRAWIAVALAQRTKVLLLDEPTTFLDVRAQLDVLTLVARLRDELDLTVGWVLHDLNQAAAHSDRIVALRDGRVAAAGAPADVLRPEIVRDVFGVEVLVVDDPGSGRPFCLPQRPVEVHPRCEGPCSP